MTPTRAPAALGRSAAALAALCLSATLGLTGAGAAAADDGDVTAQGVLREVVVDGGDEFATGHGSAPDGTPHATEEEHPASIRLLDVDGTLLDLPPGLGTSIPAGQPVTATLDAPAGMSAAEAVESAATDPTGVEVVDVRRAPSGLAAARSATQPAGPHTLLVLPVHWGARDASDATLRAVAEESATFWSDQTGGAMTTAVTVRPSALIADPGTCSPAHLRTAALAAHGVTPSTAHRDHVAVYFPTRSDCGGWVGLGEVGGNDIWINGLARTDVLAHELGHNLGVGHANGTSCTEGGQRVPLSATCTLKEYLDVSDVMGISTGAAPGNLNTALASALGLVRSVDASPDRTVEVDLAPLGSATAVRAIRVPTDHGDLFVDYRPAVGRDTRKAAWAGVQAHRLVAPEGTLGATSELLDLRAPTGTGFSVVSAPLGSRWAIPGSGYTLTVLTQSATSARVRVSPPAPAGPFGDVPADHPFAADIAWLRTAGISLGSAAPDGSLLFDPSAPVTREAMAAFLYRQAGSPAVTTASPFVDVPPGAPFHREITWLAERGISTGTVVGDRREFRPAESVTREAMAAFLYRAKGRPAFTEPAVSPFLDVAAGAPFAKEIAWLRERGISRGTATPAGTEFRPAEPVMREAMAAFLHRSATIG
ncbi:S-layer homology domain-containing protein [Cellulomonas aerilata]|uniref:SLH domain-containing protein n=1 Tax=Cellulomonas aerilata TaxID=515326 RepID=A0A512DH51_9CELL|nr:S-layer homology domain-containing protein [Cellulomonas aerilata]GEO35808.1 hypothetical protein CAE01nite_35330 [Cellulomonas aerilata]